MLNIVYLIEEAFATAQEESRIRRARIEAAWKAENDDVPPTSDRNGRYHAPVNGYMLPLDLEFRGDYSDHVFGAGEYLPVPLTEEDDYLGGYNLSLNSFQYRRKVLAPLQAIKEAATIENKGFVVSHGTSWEREGIVVAYAYITGIKKIVDIVASALEIVLQKEEKKPDPEVYLEVGKQLVEGVVAHVKTVEGYYGPQFKMLVKMANGAKLWGTLPSCVSSGYRGNIKFSATFEPGKGGLTYFKRPTKVEIAEENA